MRNDCFHILMHQVYTTVREHFLRLFGHVYINCHIFFNIIDIKVGFVLFCLIVITLSVQNIFGSHLALSVLYYCIMHQQLHKRAYLDAFRLHFWLYIYDLTNRLIYNK